MTRLPPRLLLFVAFTVLVALVGRERAFTSTMVVFGLGWMFFGSSMESFAAQNLRLFLPFTFGRAIDWMTDRTLVIQILSGRARGG